MSLTLWKDVITSVEAAAEDPESDIEPIHLVELTDAIRMKSYVLPFIYLNAKVSGPIEEILA